MDMVDKDNCCEDNCELFISAEERCELLEEQCLKLERQLDTLYKIKQNNEKHATKRIQELATLALDLEAENKRLRRQINDLS